MELFLIRHAESTNNIRKNESDRVADPELNQRGLLQRDHLVNFIQNGLHLTNTERKSGGKVLDHLYCSAMQRALQTTQPIGQSIELKPELRNDLDKKLGTVVVAHAPNRKLSGALHEDTGAGFIKGHGTVYRKLLNSEMTVKRAGKIIDPHVRALVIDHLSQFENDPKKAFAEEVTLFHNDEKTPIKRVRVLQSKTTLKKLEQTKFAVRDRQGKPFKWMTYGNIHHLEIVQDRQSDKVSGVFVTMMEAAKRAKGIEMPKQALVQTEHGPDTEFLLALHVNDLVSVEQEEERKYYRVQTLDTGINMIMLRLHTASTLDNSREELHLSINQLLFSQWHYKKKV